MLALFVALLTLLPPADAFNLSLRANGTSFVVWPPSETAVLVVDMWVEHNCEPSAARIRSLAPLVDAFVSSLRDAGAMVIHAPSQGAHFYLSTPQREIMTAAPHSEPPFPLPHLFTVEAIFAPEPPFPLAQGDGGCDAPDARGSVEEFSKQQIETIFIHPFDGISDDAQEIFNLFLARGIRRVVLTGVHVNECLIKRPFGARMLRALGFDVVIVRDLTDVFYDSRSAPYVSRSEAKRLALAHIERHICPTTTSAEFLRGFD
jgi:nicotinamidase-related amidase